MADGRQRDAWNHTAALMALTANCHRDPKQRSTPFEPNDFHPMPSTVRRKPITKVSIGALKGMFTGEGHADIRLIEAALEDQLIDPPKAP